MQHIHHTRPTVCKQCTSNAAVYASNAPVEPVRTKLTYRVVNPAQSNVHIDKDPAQTEHTVHIAAPNNFMNGQQAIIVNPAPVPVNRPNVNHAYYSQTTPRKYMIRPIYVRLVKPSQGNLVAGQMALNRPIVQTHHATLQWWDDNARDYSHQTNDCLILFTISLHSLPIIYLKFIHNRRHFVKGIVIIADDAQLNDTKINHKKFTQFSII